MLHVRVVSPAALTGPLADRLAAAPGVQNVVVRAGAAGLTTQRAIWRSRSPDLPRLLGRQ
jgi:hypothetical protein